MNPKYRETIGCYIQISREAAGFTQQQSGDQVGIGSAAISKIERGVASPALENFIEILNVLNVLVDAMFYDAVKSSPPIIADVLDGKLKELTTEARNQILLVIRALLCSDFPAAKG